MNIIEAVKAALLEFPKISAVCNDIHIDFTDDVPTNYGLSSTGDTLLKEDILGGQIRQHNFILYAVYQSVNDYDRMANSGVLLELHTWLEQLNAKTGILDNGSNAEKLSATDTQNKYSGNIGPLAGALAGANAGTADFIGPKPVNATGRDATIYGTFFNGYQPKGVGGHGTLGKTGKTIEIETRTSSGQIKTVKQDVWQAGDGTRWYWDSEKNKYIQIKIK